MNRIFFILLLIQFSYSQAQEPWLYENSYDHGFQILESYDGGTIILATENGQSNTGKIIKINKLGELLWEHTLEENDSHFIPTSIVEDLYGNLIIGGMTNKYDLSSVDGFLLKLNACGELLWFNNIGRENAYDYVRNITLNEIGDIFIIHYIGVNNVGENYEDTTIKMFSEDGVEVWANSLLSEGESASNGITKTKDGGFLVYGYYYAPPYYDQSSSTTYLRNAIVKTDSLGNEEWRNIYRWEEDNLDTIYLSVGGEVREGKNKTYKAVTLDRNNPNLTPIFYELNETGQLEWHKNIGKADTAYNNTMLECFNDSIFMIATSTALPTDVWNRTLEVYKADEEGNILGEWVDSNISTHIRDLRWNSDSTSLYILPGAKDSNSGLSLYALKLNPYTMELDTFLTEDYTEYDYYCPEGVVEQNISFPELGVEDVFVEDKKQLRLAPNPAKNYTYVYFDIANFNRSAKIEIHNLQGQLINTYPILASTGRLYEDLSPYTSGIYVVSLIMDNRLLESSKLVVD
jgi:hypothetical protein